MHQHHNEGLSNTHSQSAHNLVAVARFCLLGSQNALVFEAKTFESLNLQLLTLQQRHRQLFCIHKMLSDWPSTTNCHSFLAEAL